MEKAVTQYSGRWDVYINLSDNTLPVHAQDQMAELFAGPLKGIILSHRSSMKRDSGQHLSLRFTRGGTNGVTIPTVRHTIWSTLTMMVSHITISTSQPVLGVYGCR
jgi:hypothetical protein